MFLLLIIFLMLIYFSIVLSILIKKISLSFELIFNKLKIDTEIWGSDKYD